MTKSTKIFNDQISKTMPKVVVVYNTEKFNNNILTIKRNSGHETTADVIRTAVAEKAERVERGNL